jgi:N-acetylglucosaminyl-diphospho-decaprenol L-rhamnosyltransferase
VISIVIVNWNSGSLLENCIRSLLQYAEGCEIVVVDNASKDSSLQFLEEINSDLSILRNQQNVGYAAGNNIGWRFCQGDIILFLNPDTECFPESIQRLEQNLQTDSSVWAVGGRLVNPAEKPRLSYDARAFPSIGSVAAEMLFLDEIWPSNPWSGAIAVENTTLAIDVDQPPAACLMVTRTALEFIGGFDEDFGLAWFEDVDFCKRIYDRGGRIQYQPRARFLHHGAQSLTHLSRQEFLEIFHTNQIRYFKKHHGLKKAAQVRRCILSGLILRSALSFVYPLAPNMSRGTAVRAFWNAARYVSQLSEVEL